jgi:16S rRNA processing protein RimM
VPRERLPVPDAEEFYYADLIGLRAEDTAGRTIGSVVAVHNFGAGDILEIAPAGGGDTVMLPFSTAVVPSVEIAAGRIVVERPEGLLAPDAAAAASVVAKKNKGA